MLVKKTILEEVNLTFPLFVRYGGAFKIISENLYIEAGLEGIQVKEYNSVIQLVVSEGEVITEAQFNEAFETAMERINKFKFQIV